MKKTEKAILSLMAMMATGMQALYAQTADQDPGLKGDKPSDNYYWIAAVAVIIVGLVAAAIYRARHRKDNTGSLTGDINNPASGI